MFKTLILPLLGLALAAAAPPPSSAPATPDPIALLTPPPAIAADPMNKWTLNLSTGKSVTILLRPDLAPGHVQRIRELTSRGFYNDLKFHRVIPGFMAQGGDPQGTGEGGSDLPDLKAEFTAAPFFRGVVGAARSGDPDSANSQFFIMFAYEPQLDENYTFMGRVIAGMDAVDEIAVGEPPLEPTRILSARIGN